MFIAPGQFRSIRNLFRDEYENGFQKPCSASELRVTCEPPELVTIADGQITWAKAGSGTLRGVVVYSDGVERPAEGVVTVVCSEPPVVPPPVVLQPVLQRAVMVDPDQ